MTYMHVKSCLLFQVDVFLTTHDSGGVTTLDTDLAWAIEEIVHKHYASDEDMSDEEGEAVEEK